MVGEPLWVADKTVEAGHTGSVILARKLDGLLATAGVVESWAPQQER